MSAKIEVVLLQSVKWLGNKWDVVSVALAYAKNVLIAQGKVRVADKQAIAEVQQKKEKQKKQEIDAMHVFEQIAQRGAGGGALKIQKKSTPQWHLYEKVSLKDIQHAFSEQAHVVVDSSWILMPQKIESIGETSVTIQYKWKKTTIAITIL